jgi:hypothetical protein
VVVRKVAAAKVAAVNKAAVVNRAEIAGEREAAALAVAPLAAALAEFLKRRQ